jgi:hypothetical protein
MMQLSVEQLGEVLNGRACEVFRIRNDHVVSFFRFGKNTEAGEAVAASSSTKWSVSLMEAGSMPSTSANI